MSKTKKAAGSESTAALQELHNKGIAFEELAYHHENNFDGGFGKEAAQKLGYDPSEVFKTLIIEVDNEPYSVIISAADRVSLKNLARVTKGKKASFMDPHKAQVRTGYVVGGISPFGQKRPCQVVVDARATTLEYMIVSGGGRGLSVRLRTRDLIEATHAIVGDFAAR
ncbi:Cys-tRNA(Pro) deacylase [Gleimia hominis]|uniref:Cys-tRNA(Pro)/Cys-tRNA(Cys) deacylase n=1 Tax=Gleimia hominis TaxID=595468 RepID=A0ABU3I892_9ACTO|nr:Cys-tRNA(Pro) deacylase [Gleimia hominis]MDT3766603.1 Cys-tRNA(Pro) deacylase [Gleimia hominis]